MKPKWRRIRDCECSYPTAHFREADALNVTHREASLLLDMAKENDCPDGTFGDDELTLWSMFRQAIEFGQKNQ